MPSTVQVKQGVKLAGGQAPDDTTWISPASVLARIEPDLALTKAT